MFELQKVRIIRVSLIILDFASFVRKSSINCLYPYILALYNSMKKCFCKSCWSFNAIKYKVSNVINILEFGKEITDGTFPSIRNLSLDMYINLFNDFSRFVAFAEQSELICRTSTALFTSKLVGNIGGSYSFSGASSVYPSSKCSPLNSAKITASVDLPPLLANSASIFNKQAAFNSGETSSGNLS